MSCWRNLRLDLVEEPQGTRLQTCNSVNLLGFWLNQKMKFHRKIKWEFGWSQEMK